MNNDIRSLVDRFVTEITATIENSVRNALTSALSGDASARRIRGGRRVGRGVGGIARGAARILGRARGQKRDPAELERLTSALRSYIAKNPGQRIEQIGKGMSLPTKELALPAKKLIAAKQIRTKGQKRATTYFGR